MGVGEGGSSPNVYAPASRCDQGTRPRPRLARLWVSRPLISSSTASRRASSSQIRWAARGPCQLHPRPAARRGQPLGRSGAAADGEEGAAILNGKPWTSDPKPSAKRLHHAIQSEPRTATTRPAQLTPARSRCRRPCRDPSQATSKCGTTTGGCFRIRRCWCR